MGKRGRPKSLVPKDVELKIRATSESKQKLEFIAEKLNLTMSDVTRGLIDAAYEHLSLISRVQMVGGSTEQHQAILRGHVFQMWRTVYLYAEAAMRAGLWNEWEGVTKEYLAIMQEIDQHGRMLSPEEKARPDSDKKGKSNET